MKKILYAIALFQLIQVCPLIPQIIKTAILICAVILMMFGYIMDKER